MKKILKMIEDASNHEEKIIEALVKKLNRNSYLKGLIKRLDAYDYDYLTSNSDSGVDWQVQFDVKQLKLDGIPSEYIKTALEMFLDGDHVYMNFKEGYLYQSSCDEIWLNTHEKTIHFPTNQLDRKDVWKSEKYQDEFHAWLMAEDYMQSTGYFPGIYKQDYHGNVDEFKPDMKYSELFPEDDKAKYKKMGAYLNLYKCRKELEDGYSWKLSDLLDEVYNLLSQEVIALEKEELRSILEVTEIKFGEATLKVEFGADVELKYTDAKLVDSRYGVYEITIKLESNIRKFIVLDDIINSGGILEMSLLPI